MPRLYESAGKYFLYEDEKIIFDGHEYDLFNLIAGSSIIFPLTHTRLYRFHYSSFEEEGVKAYTSVDYGSSYPDPSHSLFLACCMNEGWEKGELAVVAAPKSIEKVFGHWLEHSLKFNFDGKFSRVKNASFENFSEMNKLFEERHINEYKGDVINAIVNKFHRGNGPIVGIGPAVCIRCGYVNNYMNNTPGYICGSCRGYMSMWGD